MVSSRGERPGTAAHSADTLAVAARPGIAANTQDSLRRRAEWALAGLSVIWGSSFVMMQQALEHSSTLAFLACRFTFSAILLALYLRGGKWPSRQQNWAELKAGAWAGVFLFGGYAFQTAGLRYTSATNSAFLTGMNMVMVPLLGAFLYRRVPRWVEIVGVLVATFGMALLTLTGPAMQMSWGDFLSLLCALAFSAHILVLGHYGQRPEIQNLALTQLMMVAALSLGSFWWAETPFFDLTPALAGTILWTSVLCTALAFTLMVWAQRYTVPSRAALIFALEPVFAWITNFLITGERLSFRASCGAVLILGGVLFVELKPMRMREHPSL